MFFTPYKPPRILLNGHLQTIYPSLFRKADISIYSRERINTPDSDFLDLDWVTSSNKKLAILLHGLEGDSHRPYITGMARIMIKNNIDVLAWNFRGCSGEPNKTAGFYHSGKTEDLHTVINYGLTKYNYDSVYLIGFSMGGNVILKYLGDGIYKPDRKIGKAVVFSVPCNLASSAEKLAKWSNKIYMKRFLKFLREKIVQKNRDFPTLIEYKNFHEIKSFKHFDDLYTAPLHGFADAEDYWQKCSSDQFIEDINIPTLIVNALNDPFLPEECYPVEQARRNRKVTLHMPAQGGHTGFVLFNRENEYWSEKIAQAFILEEN